MRWRKEIIMKHEESKKIREVGRTMDSPKMTGTVENGRE